MAVHKEKTDKHTLKMSKLAPVPPSPQVVSMCLNNKCTKQN